LDRFSGVVVYTKFDLKNIYYKIRIRERDEWKTVFRIRYSYFEYKVILFDFINAPAIFQAYININCMLNHLNANFFVILIIFLEFVINIGKIEIDINKIEIIIEWPKSKSFRNV
jgi:hypothetical protein